MLDNFGPEIGGAGFSFSRKKPDAYIIDDGGKKQQDNGVGVPLYDYDDPQSNPNRHVPPASERGVRIFDISSGEDE